jgi:membrane protein DedA with SNARE-associated domain
MLTVPAGVAGMDTRRFVVLSALGTLSFEAILAAGAIGVLELL